MKVSLAWIFDHIDAELPAVSIQELVTLFNKTTAEIEGYQHIALDKERFALAQVISIGQERVVVNVFEWQADTELPVRKDLVQGYFYLIVKGDHGTVDWARSLDLGGGKDNLLPAIFVSHEADLGSWKDFFEWNDYILEVDNKSITNRPDMWGHRGFAREIAAMLDLPFKPLDSLLANIPVVERENSSYQADVKGNPFTMTISAPDLCSRFSGMYIPTVRATASLLSMAHRLLRVDAKPINYVVDATNYTMLDLGHPMHAFDADIIPDQRIEVRRARNKEMVTLLDGQSVELTDADCVVTDGNKPIALAGIMGGQQSGVSATTKALFLEAAHFDPIAIRLTAARVKSRTEASARFEKTLDPNSITDVLRRFGKLLEDAKVATLSSAAIVALGSRAQKQRITIEHAFLEKRIGTTLSPDFVAHVFKKLSFVCEISHDQGEIIYHLTIPSFRSTKDVRIKEDVLEEVVRFFGYENIPLSLPERRMAPISLHATQVVQRIKQCMAYSLRMKEVYNYAFFDEEFLQTVPFNPEHAVVMHNPVSENWRRLVTSLSINLFKLVQQGAADYDTVRLFEWGRVWTQNSEVEEKKVLAGILFERKKKIDFYQAKDELMTLFSLLSLPVSWQKIDTPLVPWYAPYESAYLVHNGVTIGAAGIVDHSFLSTVAEGSAFIFELDGDFLMNYTAPTSLYTAPSRYPSVSRDISLLVPLSYTVDYIQQQIRAAHLTITDVELVDFFVKDEWDNEKSLTFRYTIVDTTKTLTSDEIQTISSCVAQVLHECGATVR